MPPNKHPQTPKTTFFSLPAELRQHVLTYILAEPLTLTHLLLVWEPANNPVRPSDHAPTIQLHWNPQRRDADFSVAGFALTPPEMPYTTTSLGVPFAGWAGTFTTRAQASAAQMRFAALLESATPRFRTGDRFIVLENQDEAVGRALFASMYRSLYDRDAIFGRWLEIALVSRGMAETLCKAIEAVVRGIVEPSGPESLQEQHALEARERRLRFLLTAFLEGLERCGFGEGAGFGSA